MRAVAHLICLTTEVICLASNVLPTIIDLRQALEANMAVTLLGLHMTPGRSFSKQI